MRYDSNYVPQDMYDNEPDEWYPDEAIEALEEIDVNVETITPKECATMAADMRRDGLPEIATHLDQLAAYLRQLEARI